MAHLDSGLRRRLADAPVARLATVSPGAQPHIVPITFAIDGDTIVTAIDHKSKTTTRLQRLRNIEAHAAASVMIDHYDDDWSRLWWVRGDGTARIVSEGADFDQAVRRLAEKYLPYRETPPRGPAILVTVDRWASWSA